ncbi:MAG: hypothetical protein ABI193_22380 [Minicystis sp.]
MSKKRVSPRAPFVVTVALAGSALLALAPACNSVTTISNPPAPDSCPIDPPSAGASCDVQLTCDYGEACGSSFTCAPNGVWADSTPPGTCNPPAPVCPEATPEPQTACDVDGQTCQYPDNCGGSTMASCGTLEGGAPAWQLSHDAPPCNPPAPEPCTQYGEPAACQADAMCAWLVPGCGEPPLPVAGCHSKTPCASDADCVSGDVCTTVVIDPCWMQACDACGETVLVCLPKSTP